MAGHYRLTANVSGAGHTTITGPFSGTLEAAINLFQRQGFDPAYYDLSAVGRFKMNKRLKIDSGKRP